MVQAPPSSYRWSALWKLYSCYSSRVSRGLTTASGLPRHSTSLHQLALLVRHKRDNTASLCLASTAKRPDRHNGAHFVQEGTVRFCTNGHWIASDTNGIVVITNISIEGTHQESAHGCWVVRLNSATYNSRVSPGKFSLLTESPFSYIYISLSTRNDDCLQKFC